MHDPDVLQTRAINTIRFLAVDAIQTANSGHPGLPMGTAAIAYTLWTRHLRFNPQNPNWAGRDRFILSGGHGSMLLYSLLYLTGYDLSLEDLKQFRQWGSKTPGHPEATITPGVETTTGPLGQGFANGVGMAIAAAHLAAEFNRPGYELFDQNIYAIVTDGDLMEGVASEAASLAGHLRLGNLIYFYDDNRITIEGSTDLAFTEDRGKRFEAYGWQVLYVSDGNDVEAIDTAIQQAQADSRPSLIICRTVIGYGMPNRQGTSKAHSDAPGWEEIDAAKKNLDWPLEPKFYVPDEVLAFYREVGGRGTELENAWNKKVEAYREAFPAEAKELLRRLQGELPENWDRDLLQFPADPKGMATRQASGKILNQLAERMPEIMGGSADLAPSNNTFIQGAQSFQADTPGGRNLHFGVREHGMSAILNGMATYRSVVPYAASFMVFSDYARPAIRLSALSHLPCIWIFTHDSIGLGEDGPTHQPVEQLASLRAIPELLVIRPADANEVVEAWKIAVARRSAPTFIALTRQAVPVLDRSIFNHADGLQYGAYILADLGDDEPELILMASGSEVHLIIEAGARLAAEGKNVRLVSFPSWELFEQQPQTYRDKVLPPRIRKRVSIEAGVTQGWERYVGDQGVAIGINRFGASAPIKVLMEQYGMTAEHVIETALGLFNQGEMDEVD